MPPIRVLIIDDQRVFVEALTARLDIESDLSVVGSASSREVAISAIDLRAPDVLIVDLEINSDDPTELMRELRRHRPELPIIVLTERPDVEHAESAIRAGARALVPKTASTSELVEIVRGTSAGESSIPPRLLTEVLALLRDSAEPEVLEPPLDRLTRRELDILSELLLGHDRAVIAERLDVSVNTVRTHVKHILAKLGVHSSLQAVSLAVAAGLRPRPKPAPIDEDASSLGEGGRGPESGGASRPSARGGTRSIG